MPKLNRKQEFILLSSLLFLTSALVIWVRTGTVKDTYHYVQKDKALRESEEELQSVRIQWLKLTAPKRLETLAHTLGLVPPSAEQTLKYSLASRSKPKGAL